MIVVGFDTATPSTAAAVLVGERAVERRHDPAPGERPGHASHLLALVESALAGAGVGWEDVDRLAVGVGPGGFTGLRIGIATARAIAQARGLPLVPVSSLAALAAGTEGSVLAVLDARRGEAFAAARGHLDPVALPPDALAAAVAAVPGPALAVGDGAIRFRAELEAAGARVPPDDAPEHRISAIQLCRLAAVAEPAPDLGAVLPHYCREPDAKPPRP